MPHIEDHICANCAHCSSGTVTIGGRKYHICAKAALDGDVYGTLTLVSMTSDCTRYAGEWEPSAGYLSELADAEELRHDAATYYGVRQGVDFPSTLGM